MALDPRVAAILAEDVASGAPPCWRLSPAEARAQAERDIPARAGPLEPVEALVELEAPGEGGAIPITVFRPASLRSPARGLVFLHGGGWVVGSRRTHEPLCRALASTAGIAVASVEYRLAPEHPFPAAVEDAWAAVAWLAERATSLDLDPHGLGVGGDSAGGNLAAVVARRSRDAGLALACQLLLWPVTDTSRESSSYGEFAEGCGLSREDMRWFIGHYLQGSGRDDPDAAPLLARELAGLPPALVLTAEHDVLRDEGEAYARRLQEAGVPTLLRREPGMVHGFFDYLGVLPYARTALAELAAVLSDVLAGADPGAHGLARP
ncbi:MAG: alpha/beta hydrolase [Gaiellaceae bacterium]